ncbi:MULTISPECIES: phage portal protein [unclassified Mesorhizobium]|uniref:phage portal protein n=2 Tax=Mesorhizobium TaxID=68287 RepID=UPI000FCC0D12|nr:MULTISPECIES: phage portal protein [unclassified Mesorhizobium]TGP22305.1 phage portal protein [Mesorhizobium sp. M1D.F.Ca.ET.231.01.1.1]TGP24725.1 phage portal protein [Mesorhizobium sp. M1D.F.Ca.ET.234.01.1.1]TGS37328.1 phage portal protein [Mesorhizobium sp. M1D.F.Ca.ET.184.01.1.1]TGS58128.1 phage portal protein [Mesorhizobium sp. M1D.F.Ca.ET.183.01.1.1]
MRSVPLVPRRKDAAPVSAGEDEAKAVDFSPELWAAINGGWGLPTKSGVQVSTSAALQVTPFHRGILVIAEGIAQLPIEIHKRSSKGTEPAIDHPAYDVLLHRANNLQDAFQFWRTTLMHAAGAGDGISYKVMVGGQLKELIPIRPECAAVNLPNQYNFVTYDLTFEGGGFATVGSDQVLHIKGPSWSTYKGLDPAVIGREAIGLAKSTEETHAQLHRNGARPSGALESDQKLTKAQIDNLRSQWQESFGGVANTGKTPVLSGGLKWHQITQSGVDAEHIDTRKLQIEEIARLLGVFPIMLGHAGDQSPTFASADAFLEAHVRYTLQPWIKSVRSAVETQILTKEERAAGYYCRCDTSELLRGSLKDRTEYYKAALGTNSSPGWLRPNEVREDDGWNPDDEPKMDEVWQPATMAPAGQEPKPGQAETKATPRSLYVCRKLLNTDAFLKWAHGQGFKNTLPADELHVTIAYSRARIDWLTVGENWVQNPKGTLTIAPGGPRVVEALGKDGAAIALLFASTDLSWRHMAIREAGASWDWPEYQPHVTITMDAAGVDLDKVEPYRGELVFGPEIFEEVDPNPQDRADSGSATE